MKNLHKSVSYRNWPQNLASASVAVLRSLDNPSVAKTCRRTCDDPSLGWGRGIINATSYGRLEYPHFGWGGGPEACVKPGAEPKRCPLRTGTVGLGGRVALIVFATSIISSSMRSFSPTGSAASCFLHSSFLDVICCISSVMLPGNRVEI